MGIYASGRVHLLIKTDSPAEELRLVVEGRFGCDYAWNDDYTAYRCMPHRWIPGSDSSYAEYQGDYNDDAGDDEDAS